MEKKEIPFRDPPDSSVVLSDFCTGYRFRETANAGNYIQDLIIFTEPRLGVPMLLIST